VWLEAYDKAVVEDNRDQYNGNSNRYRQDDGLSRKVAQLERKVEQVTVEQPAARSAVTSVSGAQPQSTVQDSTAKELKDNMARLSRQNDELSTEVGRFRLLEEQRKGASAQPLAVSAEAPAPPRASPAEQSPPSRQPPKCYYCGGIGHLVRDCAKKKNQYVRNGGVSRADDQNDSDTVRGQTYLRLVVNGKPSKCLLDTGSYRRRLSLDSGWNPRLGVFELQMARLSRLLELQRSKRALDNII